MIAALYNEIEPFAAQWLRNLETAGHIAPGAVNERSIEDLEPADVAGPGQRHFFAGIGGWSYALRLAGVRDDANIWTGSCPCQPFSSAGKGLGVRDPRHLWPAWFALIRECRPAIIFGEQVASRDGLAWLDLVFADLERCGYAVGAADLCAAGVSAPHGRQRLYFVAYADMSGLRELGKSELRQDRDAQVWRDADGCGEAGSVADDERDRLERREQAGTTAGAAFGSGDCSVADGARPGRPRPETRQECRGKSEPRTGGSMGDSDRFSGRRNTGAIPGAQGTDESLRRGADGSRNAGEHGDHWSSAEWIPCRDPIHGVVYRPVEPGTFPLAHGVPGRVGRLRGYGNAIVPQVAATFIRAALEAA